MEEEEEQKKKKKEEEEEETVGWQLNVPATWVYLRNGSVQTIVHMCKHAEIEVADQT